MPFVKQRNGLLEVQDFYMTSDFTDFLISGEASRKDGTFTLTRGSIKRHFTYETFVIDVEKEYRQLEEGEKQYFFLQTDRRTIGVYDTAGEGYAAYWRLLCHEGFIQAYKSADGREWMNVGGLKLAEDERIFYQGFEVEGGAPLKFTRYTVYHGPHLILQNFPEGFEAGLYNEEGSLMKAARFDGKMEARLYLDYNRGGILKVTDAGGNIVYTAPAAEYAMGDAYTYTEYLLEIVYAGEVIDFGPTHLDEKPVQRMLLRNASPGEIYHDIILAISCNNGDKVELSLDGSNYGKEITVETLGAGEEKAFYVRIGKQPHSEFEVREFAITIL